MQVLVNADSNITASEGLTRTVEDAVHGAIDRYADRITRVEVHLGDVNGAKAGETDKRCMMEARVGGLKPIAVTHLAATLADAIQGAADRLERALEHTLERLEELPGRMPREEEIASVDTLRQLGDGR